MEKRALFHARLSSSIALNNSPLPFFCLSDVQLNKLVYGQPGYLPFFVDFVYFGCLSAVTSASWAAQWHKRPLPIA